MTAGLDVADGLATFGASEGLARELDPARLREIIDAVSEAVAFCDAQDRLIFWNKAYAEAARMSAMDLKPGLTFRQILEAALECKGYTSAIGREQEWLEERMAQHNAPHSLHEHPQNDGRWVRIEERRTADGGVIMVLVDITDLKRDAQALAEARDQAQKANRSKGEFLANMSHEIRTPLNGVVGLADVLSRTDLNGHQREIVDIIRSSGVTLERLLNEVLDLARIESGRMEVRNECFDLARTVRDVAGLAELRARDKGVGFRLEMDAAASAMVHGDPDRLKQILLNLLSNAVKFTSIGEVWLKVIAVTFDEVRSFRFEVRDTGVGFSMEDKERLFQRFEQADGSITRRFGGSGLGLAIAFELAGLMGGWIDAESIEGQGATFIVQLPLPEASGRMAEPTPNDGSSNGDVDADLPALRARVLLAEDHPINRKVVELILQTTGAELTSVENGALALEAFKAGAFDMVLMDVQMPVMDGLTAIRAIRAHEQAAALARTPVVALTANALPEHVKASADAGADAHLTKPITAASLLPLVEQLVRSSRALRELHAASAA